MYALHYDELARGSSFTQGKKEMWQLLIVYLTSSYCIFEKSMQSVCHLPPFPIAYHKVKAHMWQAPYVFQSANPNSLFYQTSDISLYWREPGFTCLCRIENFLTNSLIIVHVYKKMNIYLNGMMFISNFQICLHNRFKIALFSIESNKLYVVNPKRKCFLSSVL